MPALDLLQYLPAPRQQKQVVARRRAILAHPLVRPDYTVEKKKHLQQISQDLRAAGHDTATPSYVGRDLRLYRHAHVYLTTPDSRQKLRQLALKKPSSYEYFGVRLLIEHGIETLEQLLERAGEAAPPTPPSPAAAEAPPGIDAEVAEVISDLQRAGTIIRKLSEDLQESWRLVEVIQEESRKREERIRELEAAEETSEGKKLAGVLQWFVETHGEVPPKLVELLESPPKTLPLHEPEVKPTRPSVELPSRSGYGVVFRYTREFLDEFERRTVGQQRQVAKTLAQLHPTMKQKSLGTVKPKGHLPGLPRGGLVSQAGDWRLGWKKEGDHIQVYLLFHRGNSRYYTSER